MVVNISDDDQINGRNMSWTVHLVNLCTCILEAFVFNGLCNFLVFMSLPSDETDQKEKGRKGSGQRGEDYVV